MKTVLILTNSFPPVNTIAVYRYLSMARYLPEYGWKVIVVTPKWTLENRTQLEKQIGAIPNNPESKFSRWDFDFKLDEGLCVERIKFRSREELGEKAFLKVLRKCNAQYFDYLLGDLPARMLQRTREISR